MASPRAAADGATAEKLAGILKEQLIDGGPGCVATVVEGDQTLASVAIGWRDIEAKIPHDLASAFDIASVTKQFTGTAIALLAAEGKLALDAPVGEFFPEMKHLPRTLTVEHLLHHTGGIRDYLDLAAAAGYGDYFTVEQALALIAGQRRLNFEPGANYSYSNTGYFLLGEIVRRVSGMSFRDYVTKEIFTPLGMAASIVRDHREMHVANGAIGYRRLEAGGFERALTDLEMVGDGSMWTTVGDLTRWQENYFNDSLGTLRRMTQAKPLNDGRVIPYGFGLRLLERRGQRVLSHGGSYVGYRSGFVSIPALKLGAHFLCNDRGINTQPIIESLADLLLDHAGIAPAAEAEGAACQGADCTPFVGVYAGDWVGNASVWTIATDSAAGLKLILPGQAAADLRRFPDGTWRARLATGATATMRFVSRGGRATALTAEVSGLESGVLARLAPWQPRDGELSALAGRYRLPEVGNCIEIAVDADGLKLTAGAGTTRLQALLPDSFLDGGGAWTSPFSRIDVVRKGGRLTVASVSGYGLKGLAVESVPSGSCPIISASTPKH